MVGDRSLGGEGGGGSRNGNAGELWRLRGGEALTVLLLQERSPSGTPEPAGGSQQGARQRCPASGGFGGLERREGRVPHRPPWAVSRTR